MNGGAVWGYLGRLREHT